MSGVQGTITRSASSTAAGAAVLRAGGVSIITRSHPARLARSIRTELYAARSRNQPKVERKAIKRARRDATDRP